MDLWNAVEKDKVVQAARRAAAARNKTRMDPSQAPLKKVLQPWLLSLVPLPLCVGTRSSGLVLFQHFDGTKPSHSPVKRFLLDWHSLHCCLHACNTSLPMQQVCMLAMHSH